MLANYINYFFLYIIKLFNILNLSFHYIKYISLCMHYISHFLTILNKLTDLTYYKKYILGKTFIFKKIFLNKNTYYKTFIAKSLKDLSCAGLVLSSPSINTYLIQKNFTFYYKAFLLKLKVFTIVLDYKKLLFVMFSFKLILFNLYFYNIRVLV